MNSAWGGQEKKQGGAEIFLRLSGMILLPPIFFSAPAKINPAHATELHFNLFKRVHIKQILFKLSLVLPYPGTVSEGVQRVRRTPWQKIWGVLAPPRIFNIIYYMYLVCA